MVSKWLAPLFLKKGTIDKSGETEIRQRSTLQNVSAFLDQQEVDQHGSIIVAPADAQPAPFEW